MTRIELTLNIDEDERTALESLNQTEGRPISQLVSEVVKSFLHGQSREERRLAASLAALREYRMRDPEYQHAIDALVAAEAAFEDPLDGEPVHGEFVDGQFKPAGPIQNRIRKLLGA